MKWRDVLIGSIATLVVTILSGIVIYYLTREPRIEPKENLVFVVDNSSSFDFANNKMSVASIVLINRGAKPANNVTGEIKFPFGHVKDKKVTSISGANSEIKTIADSPDRYSFSLARFLPNDTITMSFLVDTATVDPKVTIRSDTSIATKAAYGEPMPATSDSSFSKTVGSVAVPVVLGSLVSLLLAFLARMKSVGRPRESCLNNTAFVLMHKDMIEQADDMLRRAVEDGKDGCHAIANYGLSRGLLGKEEESLTLLEAALFLANSKHEKAIIQFNRSLLSMKGSLWDEAKEQLSKALKLSSAEIRRYCQNSKLFSGLAKDRPDILGMIK